MKGASVLTAPACRLRFGDLSANVNISRKDVSMLHTAVGFSFHLAMTSGTTSLALLPLTTASTAEREAVDSPHFPPPLAAETPNKKHLKTFDEALYVIKNYTRRYAILDEVLHLTKRFI